MWRHRNVSPTEGQSKIKGRPVPIQGIRAETQDPDPQSQ